MKTVHNFYRNSLTLFSLRIKATYTRHSFNKYKIKGLFGGNISMNTSRKEKTNLIYP